jgi:hypothetical protein
MHRAGVMFMTGTDLSAAMFAGFSVHHEMELLVQAGFTPLEALQRQRNPALFWRRTSSTSSQVRLQILSCLTPIPLDIRNTQRIDAVALNGTYTKAKRFATEAETSAKKPKRASTDYAARPAATK